MTPSTPSKTELRKALRQRRRRLDQEQQRSAARAVCHNVAMLPAWPGAHRIALYLAADGEIATDFIGRRARTQGKRLFLPVIGRDNRMAFAEWAETCPLETNRFGIPEPPPDATRCPAAELDIIFLPLVGWDRSGGRLGMGGGFYDRTLAGLSGPVLAGLGHADQEVQEVPREEWDVPLHFVVTDTELIRCQ
jgi:5-formyltetrahydrofolate cyclo-ligase